MLENWNGDCDTPLQLAEAEPCPGQPPLSRPIDQKDSIDAPRLALRKDCAFEIVKISPGESFWPIITVIPS